MEIFLHDGKRAREEAKNRLDPVRRKILDDYEHLIGHPYSKSLDESLVELMGGREVRYCGGCITLNYDPERLNIEVDASDIITDLRFG
ncbi:hypothetical protein [Pseudomonas putida]|uniref:Uncharacterized protein n=1 Tax=Pseudomonas putida TaxID=303 RepID=A0A8I1ECI6_PSEPU|nr:hypothetical protein [Pseudomonas putida]MBI6883280.1 hypothetical protein [Pseudomonas putida]